MQTACYRHLARRQRLSYRYYYSTKPKPSKHDDDSHDIPTAPTLYDFHWFFGTTQPAFSWPSHIEKSELLPIEFRKRHINHKVTLFEKGDDKQTPSILVFSRFGIALSTDHETAIDLHTIQTQQDLVERLHKEQRWTWVDKDSSYYFVCMHNNRDARCGTCGPPVLQALRHAGITTSYPCSHVGGHKWAANVLRASSSTGLEWFCQVDPNAIPSLISYASPPRPHKTSTIVYHRHPTGDFTYRGTSW